MGSIMVCGAGVTLSSYRDQWLETMSRSHTVHDGDGEQL